MCTDSLRSGYGLVILLIFMQSMDGPEFEECCALDRGEGLVVCVVGGTVKRVVKLIADLCPAWRIMER